MIRSNDNQDIIVEGFDLEHFHHFVERFVKKLFASRSVGMSRSVSDSFHY